MDEDKELKKLLGDLIIVQRKNNSLRWSFFKGIFSGFGVFIGSAILVAVFLFFLSLIDTAPFVGEYVSRIIEFVSEK